jgi:hypothetical protein
MSLGCPILAAASFLKNSPYHKLNCFINKLTFHLKPIQYLLRRPQYVGVTHWIPGSGKNNSIGQKVITDQKQLHRAVVSHLRFIQKSPQRVRSYYHSETTKYAA